MGPDFFKVLKTMSKETNRAALKRLERAKAEYEDALRAYRTEEEIRVALTSAIEVNLRNVQIYSAYYNGARRVIEMMADEYSFINQSQGKSSAENKVYRKAIFDLLTEDIRKTELYMSGADIGFCNHVRDKKGKLTKCDAYFYDEYLMRKKIEE